ncbi:MAG: hypothetical protein AAFV33_18560 [Chloroflexota bacterium]
MSGKSTPGRRVEYVAPDVRKLRQYAREVCDDLAEKGDESLNDRDVVNGLTEFMRIAGRIQAKYLNRLVSVDSSDDPQYGE